MLATLFSLIFAAAEDGADAGKAIALGVGAAWAPWAPVSASASSSAR